MNRSIARRFRLFRFVVVLLAAACAAWPGRAQGQDQPLTQASKAPAQAAPAESDSSRLFFGPTARAVPAGHGYAGLWELTVPVAQVGVTDRLSLGGAFWPWALGDSHVAVLVTPKFQVFRSGRSAFAVGVLGGYASDEGGFAVPFFVGTFGNPDAAFTAAFIGTTNEDLKPGLTMFGFEKTLSPRVRFISENWIVGSAVGGLASGGIRYARRHMYVDVGGGVIIGDDGSAVPLIVLNLLWKF